MDRGWDWFFGELRPLPWCLGIVLVHIKVDESEVFSAGRCSMRLFMMERMQSIYHIDEF